MTTPTPVPWAITAIGSDAVVDSAEAAGHTAAWTAALRAARAALLTGELDTLAITINNHRDALYTPARNHHGRIDPDQLTAALIDLHHAATTGDLAHQLTATSV